MHMVWLPSIWLAQDGGAADQPAFTSTILFPMILIMGMFFFFQIMTQRKKGKKRDAMLSGLKKNDHVIAAGGIYGVITSVKPDDPHVMIRVDDTTNCKLQIAKACIQELINNSEANE